MWLQTRVGFFSIVSKPGDAAQDRLTVRARVEADLVGLRQRYLPELGPIQMSKSNDYRYRAHVSRSALAKAMGQIALGIDYDNFKNIVKKEQGAERAHIYGNVWGALYVLQEQEQVKKKPTKTADWPIASADAYGGVLLTRTGQVLLREPTNHFDGYVWTFPKGKPDRGEHPQVTAMREVVEETGYQVEVVDVLPGVFKSGLSSNAYFVMRHLMGSPGEPSWETQSLRWAYFDEAAKLISMSSNLKGRARDLAVLEAARKWFDKNKTVVLPEEVG